MSLYPVEIHIMRTAAELWELAGPDMWLYRWSENGHALMQGKACDRCAMEAGEFADYQRMRGAWKGAGQDLAGAPRVSMLVVESEDEMELAALRLRPVSHFARAFNVMEALLLAHAKSLDEEDREEMLRRLAGQMASLKTAVLRAEEIWLEEKPDAEIERLRAALARLRIDHDHHVERANEAEAKVERLVFELQQERGGAA